MHANLMLICDFDANILTSNNMSILYHLRKTRTVHQKILSSKRPKICATYIKE